MAKTLIFLCLVICTALSVNAQFNGQFNGQGNSACTTCGRGNGRNNQINARGARRSAGAAGAAGAGSDFDCRAFMDNLEGVLNGNLIKNIGIRCPETTARRSRGGPESAGDRVVVAGRPAPTPTTRRTPTPTRRPTQAPTMIRTQAPPTRRPTQAPTERPTQAPAPVSTPAPILPPVRQANIRIPNPRPAGVKPNLKPTVQQAAPAPPKPAPQPTNRPTTKLRRIVKEPSPYISNTCAGPVRVPAKRGCKEFNGIECPGTLVFDITLCQCNYADLIDPDTCLRR